MTGKADEALDRLLKGAMRRDAEAADACPDAEMLAAFAEGAISAQERTQVERHVADCGRCAQALALLTETADVVPTAAAGGAGSNWFSWGAWRWLVPVATATAVLAIWFALPHGNPDVPRSDGQVALQEPPAVAPRSVEPPTPPASTLVSPSADTSASPQQPSRRSEPPPTSVSGSLSKSRSDVAVDGLAVAVQAEQRAAESTVSTARQEVAPPPALAAPAPAASAFAPPQAAPAPPDDLRQQQRELASAARDANEAKEERAEPAPPPVPVPQTAQGRGGARGGAGRGGGALGGGAPAGGGGGAGRGGGAVTEAPIARAAAGAFAPAPLVLRGRNDSIQWRVTGSTIERSTDGGATWSLDFRANAAVTAGAVAADDIVWLVGRSGLILRRDASGWAVLNPPDRSDLSGLSDVATRSATITYADGRRFSTEDAGVSWQTR